MTSSGERRRTAAVLLVTVFVVSGAGVVVTGATTHTDGSAALQETTTTAEPAAGVSLENLSAPDRVRVGTNYTVSATIVNQDDEPLREQISYQIAGNVISAKFADVPANGTGTVQFNVTENDTAGFPTGTFTHGVFSEDAAVTANVTLAGETNETTTETTEAANVTTTETTTTEETTTTTETTETTTTEDAGQAGVITETTTATTTTAEETITTTTTAGENETTAQAEERTASLTFERQDSNGSAVTVQSVTLPEGGFVVIHDNGVVEGEVVESILGVSDYVEPGTHENVTVEVDPSLNQSQELIAITYRDSNGNREFDFVTSNGTADGPYTEVDSREAVNGMAVVDVTDETANETTES
jgi:hypothetical protein